MTYLLDTDISSYLIKRNHIYHQKVLTKLLSLSPDEVAISVITASELVSGLKQVPDQNSEHKKRLSLALDYFLTSINILDYTFNDALIYGEIRAHLKSIGNDIGAMDCLIAAHAISQNRVLVSNNHNHFNRIPNLKLENWL